MRPANVSFLFSLAVAFLMFMPVKTEAYDRYNDGCQNCHGSFTGSTSPKGSVFPGSDKHQMHRSSSSMNADCDLCHTSGDDRDPFIGSSTGTNNNTGYGCVGCHGRLEDSGNDGISPGLGAGLRQHHNNTGITSCAICHTDANPINYTTVGEDVRPPYYDTADSNVKGSCNTGSLSNENENWTIGDLLGLDNDGDLFWDGTDADCAPASEGFSKVVALPDVNANGNTDLAVIRTGSIIVEIRDGQAGALLNTMFFLSNDFTPVNGVALSDADGNGVSEFAVLAVRNSDGRMVVEIRNVSGAAAPRQIWFAAGHTPVTLAVIEADADGNTVPEIAVLSSRDSDGRGLVEVKNAFGATNPNAIWVGPGLAATDPGDYALSDLEIVPDADNNGVAEVAVLMTRISDSRIVVDIQNAAGATAPHAVWFMAGNTAIDLAIVPDKDANSVPELAVLSTRDSDGRNVVEIKNAAGPTLASAVWFAPGNSAKQVNAVMDTDNNGIPEVAVGSVRDSDNRTLIEVKNVSGATNTQSLWYPPGFTSAAMTILNDVDNNSVEEVGVLMFRDTDDRILVRGRNADSSNSPIDYWFSP